VQLNKIAAQATRAKNKSGEIESEQSKLKKELDKAREHEKAFEDEVGRVSRRLEVLEQSTLALHKDFRTMEVQLNKDLGDRLALAERKLQQGQEEREREVRELKTQVEDLRDQLPDIVKDVIGLRDSMEEAKEQMNQLGLTALFVTTSAMPK
jgi:predicted  nucleic acid-binding Zn-ribbon protein